MPHIPLALVLLAAAPVMAPPGGDIGTLRIGAWACEHPASASTPATPDPAPNLRVVANSSYQTDKGSGTYLLLGNEVTITSGPLAGQRYRRESAARLIVIDPTGTPTGTQCIRQGTPGASAGRAGSHHH